MRPTTGVDAARVVLADAIDRKIFPAAVVEVGNSAALLWREALGTLTFPQADLPPATTAGTVFDLASLTKPLATATIVLDLVARGRVSLADRVADFFPEWRSADRMAVTIGDLLEHASGLPARLVDPPPEGRRAFEHEICAIALEYPPRSQSLYSDLGFILLGFLAADRAGEPIDRAFARLAESTGPDGLSLTFPVPADRRADVAPTIAMAQDLRRGRLLVGEVHDNYAAALGGVAGHAGLFGPASAVGGIGRVLLNAARGSAAWPSPFSPAMTRLAIARSSVPGSSRALGWDTMLSTSSCGTRMSATAFGHVGFTGTSLWIDPERDRYFVLLTNRACGGGTPDAMRQVRRAFHDALGDL